MTLINSRYLYQTIFAARLIMMPGVGFLLFCLLLSCSSGGGGTAYSAAAVGEGAPCSAVKLLNVVPYPDSGDMAGWDRGFEVIPAGHLAAAHINNRTDLLSGLRVEIEDIGSEACGRSLVADGLLGVFERVINMPCIAGIIGLFCSAVTEQIIPLANHSLYGYVQLSSSTSPILSNQVMFPDVFRIMSSSEVFNRAMLAIMGEFNWTRVSLIYDSMGIYFDSTGSNFVKLINSEPDKTLLSSTPIVPTDMDFSNIFATMNSVQSTIAYYSVTEEESAAIMCEAFMRNQLWRDGYVHIFHERTVADMLNNPVPCSQKEMMEAIEGVYSLQYRVEPSPASYQLVSGLPYETYQDEYLEKLEEFGKVTGMVLESNEYANTLYDQVWAFALAMNQSLGRVSLINSSFEATYQNTPNLRETLAEELRKVGFNGVSGRIRFGKSQEAVTFVNIFQIRDGNPIYIGLFNSFSTNIIFAENFTETFDLQDLPDDQPETVHYLLPIWLGASALTAQGALLIMLIVNTLLLVYHRKSPEIRSSSFIVSLITMVGCYSLCISSALYAAYSSFYIADTDVFVVLCYLELWLSLNGLTILFIPLLFRLLRIFHVFASFRSTGKHFSDKYLLVFIFFVCSVMVILLVIWNAVDPLRFEPDVTYTQPHLHPPYFLEYAKCSGHLTGLWLILSYCLIGMILVVVLVLAIKTRHIKRKNFKDTKKVNIFVFSTSTILMTFFPLSYILLEVKVYIGAFVFKWLAYFFVSFLCQMFLFVPKIFPVLMSPRKKDKLYGAALARTAVIASLNASYYTDITKM